MYTTRPLSLYKHSPETISLPPECPNSGYLVIQDEESTPTSCFGLYTDSLIKDLPLPQNKRLSIRYTTAHTTISYQVYLIPVINQPLSANRYYAIKADGKDKGESYACSKEQDKANFCFCIPCIQDVKPRPLFDPRDVYQQFEFSITPTCIGKSIVAKSVTPDGHPPQFLRRSGWYIVSESIKKFTMREARGIDSSLRARLPDFGFSSSQDCSKSLVVGKWYCPFMFIKEQRKKDQIKRSVFYEMTLEQHWERIFAAEKNYNQGKTVTVDVIIPTKTIRIAGQEAMQRERTGDREVVWLKTIAGRGPEEQIGLSSLIVERMIWEEERVGWVNEKEKRVRVVRNEEYGGIGDWKSFGCYLLVESFVLKRIDGSIALTYDYRHIHQIRSKWE